ncbi:hypothetical protein OCU04_010907 [Sclerotinia nivalis]|uniref:BTB domain-containing protein n=1 Tax=Sclerotinia nivalis TaxID=352851 RepID=A0A9X0AD76_9HELO|nr:hypothetical protein OCU04_010907 [Sclerotinia nivalis]
MAAPSDSLVTVDPDGDLVLLLSPIPFGSFTSDESSIFETQIDPPATSIFGTPPATLFIAKTIGIPDEKLNSTQLYRYHLLVSAKHMSLASPVFKAVLAGGFRETVELREKGRTEVALPDDDADAMTILIDVIHGRFKLVSKTLNLGTLTRMSILVDKYQCHESVDFLRNVWTANFQTHRWSRNWYNTACWICVAWVFELDAEFKEATESVIRDSNTGIAVMLKRHKLDLPIKKLSVDEMRLNTINQAIQILSDMISNYQGSTLMCPTTSAPASMSQSDSTTIGPSLSHVARFSDSVSIASHRQDCDSMVLGSLIKSATSKGQFPLPQAPLYNSLSFYTIKSKLEALGVMTGCNMVLQDTSYHHDIRRQLRLGVTIIDADISGLNLADFKKAPGST